MGFDQVLGILLVCFGLFTSYQRFRGSEAMFRKLQPMKDLWGEKLGNAIHIGAYCVLPIVAGLSFFFGTR